MSANGECAPSPQPLSRGERGYVVAAHFAGLLVAALLIATVISQRPLPDSLDPAARVVVEPLVLDRDGQPLDLRYDGGWNLHERIPLERIPPLLRAAFVEAEDRRFWTHQGVDWRARGSALWTNLRSGRAVRGASTITEQSLRLLHPRPRTLWSRWVEGFEALRLDARFAKADLLEFYLNQVPYGANRRGVAQAARYYFGRSLETLSDRETLALAVLVRAPSRLVKQPEALDAAVARLAARLHTQGLLDDTRLAQLEEQPLQWQRERPALAAAHFVAEARRQWQAQQGGARETALRSSLDALLQAQAEQFLAQRLRDLQKNGVRQGALLVADLQGNLVRAYASIDLDHPEVVGIDAVQALRQPGSTLKPLLYAMAIEKGWRADTRLDDGRLTERVGSGLHEYRNYSRTHYGAVTLREALGNSLNIPAVKALQFIGGDAFLARLRALGMSALTQPADFYGDGIALGNAEISLYQLVQAYATLARGGRHQPLSALAQPPGPRPQRQLIAREAALSVSDILSDPQARLLEFGAGGLLRFPVRTAVKTGTSTDYRDAWTVAYNGRYVIGVWMGNLSGRATDGITGAQGPALLTRTLLARLGEGGATPLRLPPAVTVAANANANAAVVEPLPPPAHPRLAQPFDGLMLAMDPRIPDALEAFEFEAEWDRPLAEVWWHVNDQPPVRGEGARYLWPLARGTQQVWAELVAADGSRERTEAVRFRVR